MFEFFQTRMGGTFFQGTLPRLVEALEKLASVLAKEGGLADDHEKRLQQVEQQCQALSALNVSLSEQLQRLGREPEVASFVGELAAEDCEYGDNCPPHGTRHGQCLPCRARAALHAHQKEGA